MTYNIEIEYADLNPGANQVVITAIDVIGEQRDTTVTVNFADGVTWVQPYTATFSTATQISDVAHVVDGKWHLVPGEGVRIDSSATGYDRLIAIGDYRWTPNYEILLPMTITWHCRRNWVNDPEGSGLALGWQGHRIPTQPQALRAIPDDLLDQGSTGGTAGADVVSPESRWGEGEHESYCFL